MRVFSIQHHRQGLTEVERIAAGIDGVVDRLRELPEVNGAVVLSTCNRVEVLLDTEGESGPGHLRAVLNDHFDAPPAWDLFLGEAALGHMFRVAAGLDSMVVGEREIAGQLRRALTDAQDTGHTSLPLSIAIDEALKTSRRIARETSLEGAGRSIVTAGLDLIDLDDWSNARVLIVGTGTYAGAVVAALRRRGVQHMDVHSASNRGHQFAESHGIGHIESLPDALASADLVVTCRGRGPHAVTASDVTGPTIFLDLSLKRDVDPAVAALPEVQLVDLAVIQQAVGSGIAEDTRRAQSMVNEGIAEALTKLRARVVDPAVVGLREAVMDLVDDEVGRLPQRPLSHEDASLALRRLATRLLHIPSTRAKLAAESGRTDEYLNAMAELYGIGESPGIDADTLECQSCPVTNLRLVDLDSTASTSTPTMEAM